MVDRTFLRSIGTGSTALEGNDVVVLDGTPRIRAVEEGAVAVFAAEVEDGTVVGPRRFLFRQGAREPLVALPAPVGRCLGLLAVPVGDASLVDVTLPDLADALREREEAQPLVDVWVDRLGRVLADGPPPSSAARPVGPGDVVLEPGDAVRPESGSVVWVAVEEGRVTLAGDGRMAIEEGSGPFPVAPAVWVTAEGTVRLTVLDTRAAGRDGAVLEAGLTRFQEVVLAHLERRESAERDAERTRLQEKARQQADRTEAAVEELASVMDARSEPRKAATSLLTVVRAIGDRIGFEAKPPSASENPAQAGDPLDAIARASRVRTRRVLLEGLWWKRDCGPLLAYTADDARRPLALLQGRWQRYELYDPETRERTKIDARVADTIDPIAVMFYRPLPDKRLRLRDLLRHSLAGRRGDFLLVLLTGVAATLLGMLTPQATAVLVDDAIPEANRRLLFELGFALGAAAFGQALFALAQGVVTMRIGIQAEVASQAALWDRLLSLRPSFFRRYSTGDLQSRVTAATDVGRELNTATLHTMFSGFLALLNLGLLFYYSARLALIAVSLTLVALLVTSGFAFLIRRRMSVLHDLAGRFYGLVIQLIRGVSKLRVAGAEQRAYTHWVRQYSRQLRLQMEAERYEDYVNVFNTVLPTIGLGVLFWVAYGQLGDQRLSAGAFLAFHVAFGTFLAGATSLSDTLVGVLDAVTKSRRVQPILDAEPEADSAKADPGRLAGRVELERVTFRYREDGPKVLDEVSLQAEPGEFIAIVGPSGSGKSTVFRLILGFEGPESGSILFDGQDLAGVDVRGVRRQIGTVLQEGRLNTGSIYENIAGGAIVTLDEALEAAHDAGLADDLAAMPMGLHTVVSEGGGNLSGGQRQRLLIARALVQQPRILLFDEATSALDNRTQDIVSKSLARRNVTRIVIAHRLSTIQQADRVYVLEAGRVAQQGSFVALASRDGLFARLMQRQMT